ncbi:unnamed protein product [Sympodiomycopsis kandeliae]
MAGTSSRRSDPSRRVSKDKQERIQRALSRINSSSNPNIVKIAAEEGCHAATLYNRLRKGQVGSAVEAWDRKQKLTPDQESLLVNLVMSSFSKGKPMTPGDMKRVGEELLLGSGHPKPTLGVNWPATFRKRHPELNAKWDEIGRPRALRTKRTESADQPTPPSPPARLQTPETVMEHFNLIDRLFTENDLATKKHIAAKLSKSYEKVYAEEQRLKARLEALERLEASQQRADPGENGQTEDGQEELAQHTISDVEDLPPGEESRRRARRMVTTRRHSKRRQAGVEAG